MAQIAITKLNDGPRNAVFHVAIAGDGSGDLTDQVIIDPMGFDPALPSAPTLTLMELHYDLDGFSGRLEYGYLTENVPLWTMSGGQYSCVDFGKFGGLKDRSPTADGNGKLLLTTSGLGSGDTGNFVVWVRKD